MKTKLTFLIVLLCIQSAIFAQWNSTSTNTPICTMTDKQVDPRITEDGRGGAFVAWKDYRNGSSNPDIYIQRIDKNGFVLWQTDGVSLSANLADQSTPNITADGLGGAIVAWSDWRSGIERDIYAQKIDSNGVVKWTIDGAIVTDKVNREHNEKITTDGKGGAIIAWEQQSGGQWDVWVQRLDANGQRMWGNGGVSLCIATGNRVNVKIQKDGQGGAFIAWQDLRNGVDYDIYIQRMDSNGTRMWGDAAIPVSQAIGTQVNPKIDPDTISGGVYVAWVDDRSGDHDIFAQRISSAGAKLWSINGVSVCAASGGQSAPDIASGASMGAGVVVTWKDDRNGNSDIYAQKLNENGLKLWAASGVPISTTPNTQLNPNIISDKKGNAIIAWQDSSLTNGWDIKSQKIDANGVTLWNTDGMYVSNAANDQSGPKHCSDTEGGAIYIWEDYRNGLRDIFAHRLTAGGYNVAINPSANIHNLSCYPNPFQDKIELSYTLQNAENIGFILYNAIGQQIWEKAGTLKTEGKNIENVSLPTLDNGVYYLQIIGSEKVFNHKIVKMP